RHFTCDGQSYRSAVSFNPFSSSRIPVVTNIVDDIPHYPSPTHTRTFFPDLHFSALLARSIVYSSPPCDCTGGVEKRDHCRITKTDGRRIFICFRRRKRVVCERAVFQIWDQET
ncbi:unnamed protein product, partial [Larinioides sclopetarius]